MSARRRIEEREAAWLAPYAQRSGESRGRKHPEPEHPDRSAYQRDRDRVVHSTAFRRLEYKTQVFVNHEGDHYRTRLTHTVEVSQIARTIARALAVNEDLVEAVALAHDLGHTPFGHSGEDALHELMADHGGFEHNLHGLRVVDVLEHRYVRFPGLNLTYETREGIAKHQTDYDHPQCEDFDPASRPLLEHQIVDASDGLAYSCHDLDDGLASGLLNERELREAPLADEAFARADRDAPDPGRRRRAFVVRYLINLLVTDLLTETARRIEEQGIGTVEDVRRAPERLVGFSEAVAARKKGLDAFLFDRLYRHHRVCRAANKARLFVKRLFQAYTEDPHILPDEYQARVESEGLERVVCDYIAGMTDRYAQKEYNRLFMPFGRM